MSCRHNSLRVAAAAARTGISSLANQFAAVWKSRPQFLKLRAASRPSVRGNGQRPLDVLAGQDHILPLAPGEAKGKSCGQCGAKAGDKKGSWYQVGRKACCQDCAPGQARNAGAGLSTSLDKNYVSIDPQAIPAYWPKKSTTLQPKTVTSGAVGNLKGYAVLADGKETGLSLTPGVKTAQGRIQVDDKQWLVNYDLANKPVAGPFRSVKEAQEMASLLATLAWDRPIEDFSKEDVAAVKEMVRYYRGEIKNSRLYADNDEVN